MNLVWDCMSSLHLCHRLCLRQPQSRWCPVMRGNGPQSHGGHVESQGIDMFCCPPPPPSTKTRSQTFQIEAQGANSVVYSQYGRRGNKAHSTLTSSNRISLAFLLRVLGSFSLVFYSVSQPKNRYVLAVAIL